MKMPIRILSTSAAAAATALVSVTFACTPAGASVKPAQFARATGSQATTFAGYAASTPSGAAVTSAFTAFTLPSVTCPSSGNFGVLPLAQIFSSTTTTYAAGGVFVACEQGTLIFQNFLSVNNHTASVFAFTPRAKDKITVAVKQTAAGARVTVRDITQRASETYIGLNSTFAGTDDSSNIGDGAVVIGGSAVGNPRFGSIAFSRAWTNGMAIGTMPNTAYNEASAAKGGTLRIMSSKLSAAGNWFKTTFEHA
jgi:hypothetical protein